MTQLLQYFCNLLSGLFPLILLIICGFYITFKGKFFQFSRFFESLGLVRKAVCSKREKHKGITSFQAACTALSATVGTGNIAGVAGAISIGGAGAIFWMWISAFLGMAVKFCEVALAIHFREKKGENYLGGPIYYMKKGLGKRLSFLPYIFALAGIPAVFCTGNITQVNAAVLSVGSSITVRITMGIAFALLTAAVALGGITRIGTVTEKIVPVMSLVYTVMTLVVVATNLNTVPQAFSMIFKGAFSPKAVTGGAVGSILTAVITGSSRGVFSNEAGLGTSAMAHSVAIDANADTQGLFGIFEVFFDTVFICTLTALTILCSGVNINYGSVASSELVGFALSGCFGKASQPLLAVMMCVFAFSSVIGWAVYGNICAEFLGGDRCKKLFTVIYPLFCIVGAMSGTEFAWKISELFNGIMLCVNLPAIIILSDNITYKKEVKNERKKISGNS